MGTRHLTIVKLDNKIKVAQYGQWDGYPTGQGITIANFIQNDMDLRKLKPRVRKLEWISDEEIDKRWEEVGVYSDHVSFDQSAKFKEIYPYLSRDCGAEILSIIQNEQYEVKEYDYKKHEYVIKNIKNIKVDKVANSYSFLKDGLFCEYAYKIDLDKRKVYVYTGSTKYHKAYDFKDFTEEAMEKLEKELENE